MADPNQLPSLLDYMDMKTLTGVGKVTPAGALLSETVGSLVNPPPLGQGSDVVPQYRTTPVTAQEVFRVSADPKKQSYAEWSLQYDKNKPVSFYEGLIGVPAGIGPDEIERMDPTIPPKRGVKKRMLDAINDPEVRQKMIALSMKGTNQKDWYRSKPLLEKYIQILGQERGKEKFVKDMKFFSSSSAGSSVQDNVKIASYYQYLRENDLPLDLPVKGSGYGHVLQNTQRDAILEYVENEDVDPLRKPKRKTFTSNLLGQEDYVTIDRHNMRTIAMLSKNPEFLKTSMIFEKKKDAQSFRNLGFKVGKTKGGKFKIETLKEFKK